MLCVLSDNLSAMNILDLCENVNGEEYKYDFYFQRYLYALVLWDAIYKAPRKSVSAQVYNESNKRIQENEIIKFVKSTIFDLPYDYEYNEIETAAEDIYFEWMYNDEHEKSKTVKNDVFFYLTLGQITNMNILLSERRANFVQKSEIAKKIWSREDVLKYLDKEIYEICKEIYSFMDKEFISIQTPLLVDYICKNATSLWDAINIALQLREHKDVTHFRQTMNLLDNAINEGNTLKFKEYTDTLSEIVTQICPKDIPTKKIDMKFTITPSLANLSISTMFGIPINFNKKRKINMNFLIELARYGLTQERNYIL